jgi:outer membrane receptor protein involved in Fe transport
MKAGRISLATSLFLTFILVLGSTLAFGQGIVTGSISGVVQDPQKAVVPSAKITAVQSGTNATFTTQSNGEGYFILPNLPIGTYTVTIEADKFNKLQVKSAEVNSGQNNNLGAQLLTLGATETVTVEAVAPLVETTTSQIGASFDTKAVSTLPNTGVGFDNLALYVPGMVNTGSTNFSNSNGAAIASNGLRGRSNNFQIDGQSNNDNSVAGPSIFLSNPDVIGEVQIVSNNFGAEYGRNSGSVVNYLTKTGTNAFHGSAYDFNTGNWSFSHKNEQKNPIQGFCAPGQAPGTITPFAGAPTGCSAPVIPRYVENRFGGTLGGPVLKDKAWFFASYQGDKQRSKSTGTSSSITPTPAGLAMLAAAFPGNPAVKALQTIGPYGVKAGDAHPAGTAQNITVSNGTTSVSVPFANVQRVVASPFDDTQVTGRGDWQISNNDHFFARYVYQDSVNKVGSGTISSGAFVDVPARDQQIGLDYTRTWSPRFVQQYRVSYSRAHFTFASGDAFPDCTIANVTKCPTNIAFSDSVNSFTTMGLATNLPQDRLVNVTQYTSNSTFTFSRHTIKFGGEYDRQRSPNHFLPNINGGFIFSGDGSQGPGNAFSRFIQGANSTLNLAQGTFLFNFKEQDVSFYAQDDWRIKDNLTLNLGLRWEWDQQAVNLLHDISVQNVKNGFWSSSAPSDATILPKIPEDLNNFGPNIGFAWTPRIWQSVLGQDKTVVRGGYRIAYDPAFYNIFSNVATAAPVVNLGTISNVPLPSSAIGSAVQAAYFPSIPTGANPATRNQTRVSKDFHNPYVEQWSFGIQRELGSRVALESRYAGNHGVGNFQTINGNPTISGIPASLLPSGVTPCPSGTVGAGRLNCNFTNLRVRNNGAWSIYHGLQNQITMRDFHSFTIVANYTWSKGIDNVSEIFASTGGVTTPVAQNPFDPNQAERGVSAQSFPHVFNTYWIWDLPWKRDQRGVLGRLLGGWQWSGTYRYQTGAPITPTQNTQNTACDTSFNNAFIGSTIDSCRPILSNPAAPFDSVGRYLTATQLIAVSNCASTTLVGTSACPTISPSAVRFIVNSNTAANVLCAGQPFACTVSRNIYRAMSRNQLDLSVMKTFKLTERVGLQLRADAFNVNNYMFLGIPGLNTNSRNIKGITTGGAPAPSSFANTAFNTSNNRFMQLEAHITF